MSEDTTFEDFKESLEKAGFHIKTGIKGLKSKETYDVSLNTLFKVLHELKAYARYQDFDDIYKICEKCEEVLELLKLSYAPACSDTIHWFKDVQIEFEAWAEEKENITPSYTIKNTLILNSLPSIKTEKTATSSDILKKLKILYVEDEAEIRESLALYIKRRVAKLKTAKNGEEGIKVFKEFEPDLIITDINMPKMHGFEMMEKIRAMNGDIPVIFTTAHNEEPFMEKSKKFYSNSYLVKPFEFIDLDKELRKLAKMYF